MWKVCVDYIHNFFQTAGLYEREGLISLFVYRIVTLWKFVRNGMYLGKWNAR